MEGGNLLNSPPMCCVASTMMMQRQPYCARTPSTHQIIGGVMKPIIYWGLFWRPWWWTEANGQIWSGCQGYNTFFFRQDILGFLMTT